MLYNITLKRRFELDDIAKVRRITLPRKTDHYQLWTTGHLNEALCFRNGGGWSTHCPG